MNKKRILGLSIAIAGLAITFFDFKLTGAIIGLPAEPLIKVIGILILITGLALIATEAPRERASGLANVIKTKAFEKAIKRHNIKEIENAIEKIYSGLGKEEVLHGYGDLQKYGENIRSIRVSKGRRIIFRRTPNAVELLDCIEHY